MVCCQRRRSLAKSRSQYTRRKEREEVLRKKNAPAPLPTTRPRALTPPLPVGELSTESLPSKTRYSTLKKWSFRFKKPGYYLDNAKTTKPCSAHLKRRILSQDQSPLYSKLPQEIRQFIWKHILGHKLLHVIRVPRRLLTIDCDHQDHNSADEERSCCERSSPTLSNQRGSDLASRVFYVTGLLQSCRTM